MTVEKERIVIEVDGERLCLYHLDELKFTDLHLPIHPLTRKFGGLIVGFQELGSGVIHLTIHKRLIQYLGHRYAQVDAYLKQNIYLPFTIALVRDSGQKLHLSNCQLIPSDNISHPSDITETIKISFAVNPVEYEAFSSTENDEC